MWSDEQVPAFWQDLGLPGLFDVHTHFLPEPIQRAVWAVFDSAGPKIGRPWPITYRTGVEERVATLRALGVRRFGSLPYAHKPGVAGYLNDWCADFARRTPESIWTATFYPEADATTYVADLLDRGVEMFKIHTQVGEFELAHPLLDEVWGMLEDAGVPVITHVGSGPVGNDFTGPDHLVSLLRRHPRAPIVIAHLGAPDYDAFLDLAEAHESLMLDTTMVFTDFFEETGAFPPASRPRLLELQDRILLGSDFPSIPYPYAHQFEALVRLDLGDDWLRAVCWHNGVRRLGAADNPLGAAASSP